MLIGQRQTGLLQEVRRRFHIRRWVEYRYSEPVHHVKTIICTTPQERRGTLQLLDTKLQMTPRPDSYRIQRDNFGNQSIRADWESVSDKLLVASEYTVETVANYTTIGQLVPTKIWSELDNLPSIREQFLDMTPLTFPSRAIQETVRDIIRDRKQHPFPSTASLVLELVQRVTAEMRYLPQITSVRTTAEEAWVKKCGVCQDYAHLALVFSRLASIPARYVSGFIAHPKATAMHAWIEAFVSWQTCSNNTNDPESGFWVALDPTHGCYANERYITVAIGRDYSDVKPLSGSFLGTAKAFVNSRCEIQELQNLHR